MDFFRVAKDYQRGPSKGGPKRGNWGYCLCDEIPTDDDRRLARRGEKGV